MRLPKLYAPVTISFWSLRNSLGDGLGVVFDIDTMATRKCRRVLCRNGWKWQMIDYVRYMKEPSFCFDSGLESDKEILDEYGSELEFEFA